MEESKARKSRKKLWIVLGIVALVLVALGVVGLKWHEKPSFCNAICHSPMDLYVKGYYGGDAKLLVTVHAADGVTCLECHEPKLSEQLSEAAAWVKGDFKDPLTKKRFGTRAFCLSCHEQDKIVAATVDYGGEKNANPHESHNGALDCYLCHSVHRNSTLWCNSCHKLELPQNWEAPKE